MLAKLRIQFALFQEFLGRDRKVTTIPSRERRESHAIFAQAEIASGEAIDLVLGARHDDYEFSGSKTTWRANGLWRLSDRSLLGPHLARLLEPRIFPPIFDFKFRIGKP